MGYVPQGMQAFMGSGPQNSLLKRTVWLTAAGILIFASFWSVRNAVADFFYRQNTISSLGRAVAISGGDAEFHALYAEHMESVGEDPDEQFRIAAALSPLDARYWVRLGFSAESKGNYALAEQYLLKGASVNKKFDPAWALMNFYFRRGNAERFWFWADKAMAMSYGDLSAMFRLYWDMSSDAALIRKHVPLKSQALASYLAVVESEGHFEAVGPTALELAAVCADDCVSQLQFYCERAWSRDPGNAVAVWNLMCRRRLIPFRAVDPEQGSILGDPGFRVLRGGVGFGWRPYAPDEIVVVPDEPDGGVILRFSGNEPDDCMILEQLLPRLVPHRIYRIQYNVKLNPESHIDGLIWKVVSAPDARTIAEVPIGPSGGAPLQFAADGETPLRLRLEYKRPFGAVRARGGVTIDKLRSEIVQ
jgi:hypothetical protein